MKRSEYLSALLRLMTINEIALSARDPSAHMTKTHIALHYVALRRLGYI
jgi:hypothetical protein